MNQIIIAVLAILRRKAVKWAKETAMSSATPRGEWIGKYQIMTPVSGLAGLQAGFSASTKCCLVVNDPDDPRRWRHFESGYEYMAETPIVTDGGSTPKWLRKPCKEWADLEPFGKFVDDFILHDAGYKERGVWMRTSADAEWLWLPLTRGQIDALFRDTMRTNGRKGEIFAIWRAVRRFGGAAWKNHRRREKAGAIASSRLSCNSEKR